MPQPSSSEDSHPVLRFCLGLLCLGFLLFPIVFIVGAILSPPVELRNWVGGATFVGSFGSFGIILSTLLVLILDGLSTERRLKSEHPDEPWLHHKQWANGKTRPPLMVRAFLWLCIAVAANSISFGSLAMLLIDQGRIPASDFALLLIIVIGFCIFSLCGLAIAVGRIGFAVKFGNVFCRFGCPPFEPGDAVRCTIDWADAARPSGTVLLQLTCNIAVEIEERINDDGRSSYAHVVWQSGHLIDVQPDGNGHSLTETPTRFELPQKAPDSGAGNNTTWSLEVSWNDGFGVKRALDFEVPVFRTGQREESVRDAASEFDANYSTQLGHGVHQRVGSLVEHLEFYHGDCDRQANGTTTVRLPMQDTPRWFSMLTSLVAVSMISAVAYWLLIQFGQGIHAIACLLPFCLLARSSQQKLVLDVSGLTFNSSWFGIWRDRTIAWNEIKDFRREQVGVSHWGFGLHQVAAILHNGKKIVLLPNARSLTLARQITAMLEKEAPRKLQHAS